VLPTSKVYSELLNTAIHITSDNFRSAGQLGYCVASDGLFAVAIIPHPKEESAD
jgi:hypothetical protein